MVGASGGGCVVSVVASEGEWWELLVSGSGTQVVKNNIFFYEGLSELGHVLLSDDPSESWICVQKP